MMVYTRCTASIEIDNGIQSTSKYNFHRTCTVRTVRTYEKNSEKLQKKRVSVCLPVISVITK